LGGFGAGIRRRIIRRRRLDCRRLDFGRASRPTEVVGPSARRRERLALGERADGGCIGGGSGSVTAGTHKFFRRDARGGERHDRSGCRPLCGTTRLGIRRLWAGFDRHRQRDRHALVADDALDFALDIVGKLACAEFGEIDAVAGAQAANLAFVVRTLRRVAARLVDEAVLDVDIDDTRLLDDDFIEPEPTTGD
jgi:hypothetical protein